MKFSMTGQEDCDLLIQGTNIGYLQRIPNLTN